MGVALTQKSDDDQVCKAQFAKEFIERCKGCTNLVVVNCRVVSHRKGLSSELGSVHGGEHAQMVHNAVCDEMFPELLAKLKKDIQVKLDRKADKKPDRLRRRTGRVSVRCGCSNNQAHPQRESVHGVRARASRGAKICKECF